MTTIIQTYRDEIYIVEGVTPEEVKNTIVGQAFISMPNGSQVARGDIRILQTKEDYYFQQEQKQRHKRGQHIRNGSWMDGTGEEVCKAKLTAITGTLPRLPSNT